MITVGDLRRAIAKLPNHTPVLVAGECGANDSPNFYLIPAHIESGTYGRYVNEGHRQAGYYEAALGKTIENCDALLLSEWGNDDGIDLTPGTHLPVVEGGLAWNELTDGS